MAVSSTGIPLSTLRRFARPAGKVAVAGPERCELCSQPAPAEHRHLLEVAARELRCVCQPCSILFDSQAASQGRYRLVGDRRLFLADFELDDVDWEGLRIPVGIAFLLFSTPAERMAAFYPGPMGPTESLLELSTWQTLERRNPILAGPQPDVEALLVNRARGARQHFLVPIDDCFRLIGLIRTHWRGFGGGPEVWEQIERFFAALVTRSRAVSRQGSASAS
jgi:hypothetical protein